MNKTDEKPAMSLLRSIFHIDHFIVSALTLGVIGLLVFITVNLEFLNPVVRALEGFSMTDIYYKIQHSDTPQLNQKITLVDITDLSYNDRDKIAQVVEQISSMEPSVLGVDVIFENLKGSPESNMLLTDAFFNAPTNTVLAVKLTDPDLETKTFSNSVHSFFVSETHQTEGTVNVTNNPNRSMTSYPTYFVKDNDTLYSLPVQVSRFLGFDVPPRQQFIINYRGTVFPVVKWNELEQHRELIENHIVLLGCTEEESDKHLTPIGQMAGLNILAYSTLSIIEGEEVAEAPVWVYLLWALIAGWIANMIDLLVTKRLEKRKSTFILFVLKSGLYARLISFLILVALTYVSFILFTRFDYDLSSVLALTVTVLIGEGRLLYTAFLAVLKRKGIPGWEKSIYATII